METFSALQALYAGNSPGTGEFPAQRPVTRSFDVFFDLRSNKRLTKQWWGWWFETQSSSLWRHCNVPFLHFRWVLNKVQAPERWHEWLFNANSLLIIYCVRFKQVSTFFVAGFNDAQVGVMQIECNWLSAIHFFQEVANVVFQSLANFHHMDNNESVTTGNRPFVQQRLQLTIRKTSKLRMNGPLCVSTTGVQWISHTKSQKALILCRHNMPSVSFYLYLLREDDMCTKTKHNKITFIFYRYIKHETDDHRKFTDIFYDVRNDRANTYVFVERMIWLRQIRAGSALQIGFRCLLAR